MEKHSLGGGLFMILICQWLFAENACLLQCLPCPPSFPHMQTWNDECLPSGSQKSPEMKYYSSSFLLLVAMASNLIAMADGL